MRREAKAWVHTTRLYHIGSDTLGAPCLCNTHELDADDERPDYTEVTVTWDEPDAEPAVGQVWRDSFGYENHVVAVVDDLVWIRWYVVDEWKHEVVDAASFAAWELVR